jgi:hypothetical protein
VIPFVKFIQRRAQAEITLHEVAEAQLKVEVGK